MVTYTKFMAIYTIWLACMLYKLRYYPGDLFNTDSVFTCTVLIACKLWLFGLVCLCVGWEDREDRKRKASQAQHPCQ